MLNITDKADNTPGSTGELTAPEFNDHKNCFQKMVTSSGQALTQLLTPDQAARSEFIYGIASQSFIDNAPGADTIELTPVTGATGLICVNAYAQLDGAVVRFNKSTPNTSTSVVVNIGQSTPSGLIGAKNLKKVDGSNVAVGEVRGECIIRYNLASDRWELLQSDITRKNIQYHNLFLNPSFDIAQTGVTFTNPANNTYTLDMIRNNFVNSGTLPTTITHSRAALTAGETDKAFYCYKIDISDAGSGFASGDYYLQKQFLDNAVRKFHGKQITIEFEASSSITSKKLGIYFEQDYGTGGSPSSTEIIVGKTFTLSATLAKYQLTITLNTATGKTFGTDNNDALIINFVEMWGNGTVAGYVGSTGVAESFVGAGNIRITKVQINEGYTPFEFLPIDYSIELDRCKVYREMWGHYEPGFFDQNPINFVIYSTFNKEKRKDPTITLIETYLEVEEAGISAIYGTATNISVPSKNTRGALVVILADFSANAFRQGSVRTLNPLLVDANRY